MVRVYKSMQFPELTYASETDSPLRRWTIVALERLLGRDYFADYYKIWRDQIVGKSTQEMSEMLNLIDIELNMNGNVGAVSNAPDGPLVIVANHPFGIGDGVAALSIAEKIGRPIKILINKELIKVPEIRPYALPISFDENRDAVRMNLEARRLAVEHLNLGHTVVVFPAGGVATAPKGFGKAKDLPWKLFPARMIKETNASVLPVYFEGQNSWKFHLASQISELLRMALFIYEFKKLCGGKIEAKVGSWIEPSQISRFSDRQELTDFLHEKVFELELEPNANQV